MQLYKITVVLDDTVDVIVHARTFHVCADRGVVQAINRVLARVGSVITEDPAKKIISLTLVEIEPLLWAGEVDQERGK